jgi:threonyl-tRNA synthetase
MPLWLAPEQARILTISEKTNDYAALVQNKLRLEQLRCGLDSSDEKINAKIARTHTEKLPYMLVVGPKESQTSAVNVRIRGVKESKTVPVDEFLRIAKQKIADKVMDLTI